MTEAAQPNVALLEAALANPAVQHAREQLAFFGALLFARHLTDAAGGNLSLRVSTEAGDVICMTPRYAGSSKLWNLQPHDVLITDLDERILAGDGRISREANAHFVLHRAFGAHGRAVFHAHARNILVFAALNRSMPPVLEATLKYGDIPVCEFAPSHNPDLAQHIRARMEGQEARIAGYAAAVIAPWHGLFVMARDANAAFDSVERLDTNAYCLLMGHSLRHDAAPLAAEIRDLREAAKRYGKE
jgi:L-fuculose-phosphate aldolase